MADKENSKCSCSCGCCGAEHVGQELVIDFLYLDLSVCQRCQNTQSNLDEAIAEVGAVLAAAGLGVVINRINITSKELAIKYEFKSSPTIRINGEDIAEEIAESACKDCGDLCGDSVDCRAWEHNGVIYNEPPKALILNAILRAIYSDKQKAKRKKEEYRLPHNLEAFFDGKEGKANPEKF